MTSTPYAGATTVIPQGGQSVVAIYGPVRGGFICNPTFTEQGIAQAESLYVSLTGPITLTGSGNAVTSNASVVLQPGVTFVLPRDLAGNVWVAALTAGHLFTAVVVQPATQYPPTPYTGSFPPSGPTTRVATIPSYLYKQYEDDDNLQALVAAQNQATQNYVDTFNALNLPDVTAQSGALLDWVGAGLYGIRRPTLYSGSYVGLGPLNTMTPNELPPLNALLSVALFENVTATSDDVYKRILLWHLWKGDGRQVTSTWLRRRCVRFLLGEAGQGGAVPVSVIADANRDLTVTLITGWVTLTGGALPGSMLVNAVPNNTVMATSAMNPVPALAPVLKEGIDTGALEMPGQYNVTCHIGPVGTGVRETAALGLPDILFN